VTAGSRAARSPSPSGSSRVRSCRPCRSDRCRRWPIPAVRPCVSEQDDEDARHPDEPSVEEQGARNFRGRRAAPFGRDQESDDDSDDEDEDEDEDSDDLHEQRGNSLADAIVARGARGRGRRREADILAAVTGGGSRLREAYRGSPVDLVRAMNLDADA